MKSHHSPRGGSLIAGLLACLCSLHTASAASDIPTGTLNVDRSMIRVGGRSQLDWQIQYPSVSPVGVDLVPIAKVSMRVRTSVFGELPVLPRITPQELAKLQQSSSPMAHLEKPAANEAPVARPNNQSIIKQSMILQDGTNWTLVPKGAVIFLPEAMKSRVDVKPVGTLLPFTDFLTRNRAWITTNEVSFNQAAGTEPLPSGRVAFWPTQDKVVISVHQGGPISMPIAKESSPLTQR